MNIKKALEEQEKAHDEGIRAGMFAAGLFVSLFFLYLFISSIEWSKLDYSPLLWILGLFVMMGIAGGDNDGRMG